MKFSANLGFLWTELSLPDAIRAAAEAGFDAVECHWPYETDPQLVHQALIETGLPMLGLNTSRGDLKAGENGLSALPGRETDAQKAIDQAIDYGAQIDARNVHVMAGFAEGEEATKTFLANLRYACRQAGSQGMNILVEPLNKYDAPGYFLKTTQQAVDVIEAVGAKNLKLMFDCYHAQLMEGDLTNLLAKRLPHIGHIQFASVPDRGPPNGGEVNYQHIFQHIEQLGYDAPMGAEYKPSGSTSDSLSWLNLS